MCIEFQKHPLRTVDHMEHDGVVFLRYKIADFGLIKANFYSDTLLAQQLSVLSVDRGWGMITRYSACQNSPCALSVRSSRCSSSYVETCGAWSGGICVISLGCPQILGTANPNQKDFSITDITVAKIMIEKYPAIRPGANWSITCTARTV